MALLRVLNRPEMTNQKILCSPAFRFRRVGNKGNADKRGHNCRHFATQETIVLTKKRILVGVFGMDWKRLTENDGKCFSYQVQLIYT